MNEPQGLYPVYVLEENELCTIGSYLRFFFCIFFCILRQSYQNYFVTFFYLNVNYVH